MKKVLIVLVSLLLTLITVTKVDADNSFVMTKSLTSFGISKSNGGRVPIIKDYELLTNEDGSPIVIREKDGFYIDIDAEFTGKPSYPGNFEFILPSGVHFSFSSQNKDIPFTAIVGRNGLEESIEIGTYRIVNVDGVAKVVYTFNENVNDIDSLEGVYFRGSGEVKLSGEDVTIIDGINSDVEVGTDFNWDPVDAGNQKDLTKYEVAKRTEGGISWWARINQTAGIKYYNTGEKPDMKNLMIYDDLVDGLRTNASSINLYGVFGLDSNDGANTASNNTVNLQVDQKDPSIVGRIDVSSVEMTYEEFETEVKNADKPTIGVYDESRVIISYKDLPGLGYELYPEDDAKYTSEANL